MEYMEYEHKWNNQNIANSFAFHLKSDENVKKNYLGCINNTAQQSDCVHTMAATN